MADTSSTRRERRATARAERQERERAEAARARQRKRLFQLGGALALAAAIIVVIVIATGGGGDDNTPTKQAGESMAGQREAIALFRGIEQRGTALGDPRAPITLIEFADLQCPFCRDFAMQSLPTIVNDYVKTGRVKLEFRDLAFIGTDSTRGAQMAEAVGLQNRLWEFIDIFYANQGAENEGYVTDEFLRDVAGAIPGVDVERAMADRGTERVQRLLADAQAEATQNGISATPSFLVGPTGGELEPLEVQSLDPGEFTAALDEALARAR